MGGCRQVSLKSYNRVTVSKDFHKDYSKGSVLRGLGLFAFGGGVEILD